MEKIKRKEKDVRTGRIPVILGKCLLAAYLLTGGALLLLALLLYRFQLSGQAVNIGIVVIYTAAAFLAGFFAGKGTGERGTGERRFLWGLLAGTLYFVLLALLTLLVNHGFKDLGNHFFTTLMICAGSGMLGGMLS